MCRSPPPPPTFISLSRNSPGQKEQLKSLESKCLGTRKQKGTLSGNVMLAGPIQRWDVFSVKPWG